MDQSALAARVGLSRSSMSRILSGLQEPKLGVAHALAKALGVGLDSLMEDSTEQGPETRREAVTEDEAAVLRIVRRMGVETALGRLLNVPQAQDSEAAERPRSQAT